MNREWLGQAVLRTASLLAPAGYLGPNGSGKSTD